MRVWSSFARRFVACSALVVLSLAPGSEGASDGRQLGRVVLAAVAADRGVPQGNLAIAALEPVAFPLTGITLYTVKVVDVRTGNVYGTVVDRQGNPQDLEAARLAEKAAREARFGKLEPALYDTLQKMAADEPIEVGAWLAAPDLSPPSRPKDVGPRIPAVVGESLGGKEGARAQIAARVQKIRASQVKQRELNDLARRAALASLSDQVAKLEQPLLNHLSALGFKPTYVSPLAPLVHFRLPRSVVETIAQFPEVDTVYGPNVNRDVMDIAKATQKANIVDDWFGFDGTGVNVAILEDSRIEFANPYLNDGTTRVPGDPNVDQHATATAGMVASQHSTYQGIAQGVALFSANATDYSDANLSAAMDWAAANVHIINNSWGGNAGSGNLNVHDRHLDHIVRNTWHTVTVAAGNDGPSGYVGSPAKAYNVISAGNFDDSGTLTWTGDTMNSSSSYLDPSTGVDKPEVAASGTSITSTTNVSPWIGNVGSGTSYAAPMVTGEAALLMERNTWLESWPEPVKAIVMASALHNIEGASRLSEIDGAGGVDMRAAFHIVDRGWFDGREVTSTSFPYSLTIQASAGEVVRAAIAWDSNPNASYTTDPLEADIDIEIYGPGGAFVTGSYSGANPFEIVEFTAATTGNYELRVIKYAFTGTAEYVGAAWWAGHRVLSPYVPQTLATPPVSRDCFATTAPAYWSAAAVRSPSGADYDLYLYGSSAFANPGDYSQLAYSAYVSGYVDYVLVDQNHAPATPYFPEVRAYSGTGNYAIEWATHTADTADADGTFGPYTITASQVVRVWDTQLSAGVRKYFRVKPTAGNADLGMALHDSDPAVPGSLYQGRSAAVALADAAGAGASEFLNYQATTTDWMGLVVFNKGATATTTFYLYADTTAPTGSVLINGGATYTARVNVTLSLSASDPETGIVDMRFSNDGSTWTGWEPYSGTKAWTLTPGAGTKTVYVQFRNNTEMASLPFTDTIYLDLIFEDGFE